MCWASFDQYDCGHTIRRGTKFCAAYPNCPNSKGGRSSPKEHFFVKFVEDCGACRMRNEKQKRRKATDGSRSAPSLQAANVPTPTTPATPSTPSSALQLNPQAQEWQVTPLSPQTGPASIQLGPPPPAWINYVNSLTGQGRQIDPFPLAWNQYQHTLQGQPRSAIAEYCLWQSQPRGTYIHEGQLEWDESPHPTPPPRKVRPVTVAKQRGTYIHNRKEELDESPHPTPPPRKVWPVRTEENPYPTPPRSAVSSVQFEENPELVSNDLIAEAIDRYKSRYMGTSKPLAPSHWQKFSQNLPSQKLENVTERLFQTPDRASNLQSPVALPSQISTGIGRPQAPKGTSRPHAPIGTGRPTSNRDALLVNPLAQSPTHPNRSQSVSDIYSERKRKARISQVTPPKKGGPNP
ncbi:MAG: hypothetical protein MMC33_010298 [Icmadophila ericetorum]|nr:hypothetical protein [Icmadophila ericetorum]